MSTAKNKSPGGKLVKSFFKGFFKKPESKFDLAII